MNPYGSEIRIQLGMWIWIQSGYKGVLITKRKKKIIFSFPDSKFLGLPDPDPLVRGPDPNSYIIKQK